MFFEPNVKVIASPNAEKFSMSITTTVGMVNRKELNVAFSAADASATIFFNNGEFSFCPISPIPGDCHWQKSRVVTAVAFILIRTSLFWLNVFSRPVALVLTEPRRVISKCQGYPPFSASPPLGIVT